MFEMERPPGSETESTRVITVLSVSPIDDDCAALARIFNDAYWTTYTRCKWALLTTATVESALTALQHNWIPIVLCESDLVPSSWIDMLELLTPSADPPFLIVTNRLADERFWAEALNRGAYDVLAKPFDRTEVARIVSLAWLHWKAQHEPNGVWQTWRAATGMRTSAELESAADKRPLPLPAANLLRNPISRASVARASPFTFG